MTTTSAADKLRRETERAQARAAAAARAEERRVVAETRKMTAAQKAKARKNLPEIIAKANEAAKAGKRLYDHSIIYAGEEPWPAWARLYSEELIKLLTAKSLTAKRYEHREDPFGSDPMYFHTVYYSGVIVSW
jgi:peptide methionine sulfoxide reductase MsrB